MVGTVYLVLFLLASALGQEATTGQSPTRSYSQAAQQKPSSYAQAAQQNSNPSQFSYAQAAKGPPSQAASPPPVEADGQVPTSPPPRSYAQASGGQNPSSLGTRVQANPTRSTQHPPSRGGSSQHRSPTPAPVAGNVSDDDLRTWSEDLLRSDTNNAASLVSPNWQGRTYGSNPSDLAPKPLLNLPARVFQGTTIAKMKQLYDNYEPDAAVAEVVTAYERDEDKALLEAIMSTQVMAKTKKFLVEKGLIENAPSSLKSKLQSLWFTMYPRLGGGSAVGSSAFEHIFLAEIRKGEISGFHNWLFFAHEENSGKADYLGHIRHIDLGGKGSVVKHHFKWGNITKPVGSMFIGTSPELEMALYTVCFLTRPDNKCPVRLGGEPFFIKTHSFTYRGAKYIGSAFPDI